MHAYTENVVREFPDYCHRFLLFDSLSIQDIGKKFNLAYTFAEGSMNEDDGKISGTADMDILGDTTRESFYHFNEPLPLTNSITIEIYGGMRWNLPVYPPRSMIDCESLSHGYISEDLYRIIKCFYNERVPIKITKLPNENVPVIAKDKL